jgi:hypothetical protein
MHGSLRLIIGQRRPRADVVIRAVRITYPPWIAADSREQGRRISAFLTLFGSPYPDL